MNKGWQKAKVKEVFDVQLGKMLSPKAKEGQQYNYLGNFNIQWGDINFEKLNTMHFSDREKEKFLLKENDILMCEGGEIGRCAIWRREYEDCYYQKALHRLRALKPNVIDPYYFYTYMRYITSNNGLVKIVGETSIAHLTREKLRELSFPLPSIKDQNQISNVFKKWDNAIEKTEALIAAKEKQFKWLCTSLLSKRKESFGFSGKSIPTAFGDIFSLFKEVNKSSANYEVLSVTKNGIVSQSEYFNKDIASKDRSKYLIVDKGTLVMSGLNFWMGAIDFQTIRDTGIVSPAYKTFKLNEGAYNREYLRLFVRSHYMTKILLDSSIQGASIVRRNLDMEWLSNSLIDLPNIEEQNEIANILVLAEKEINGLKLLADKYHSQKRGLMQKLLTGEWQVSTQNQTTEETRKELTEEKNA
jgi:type I restriction enzyme S subunit